MKATRPLRTKVRPGSPPPVIRRRPAVALLVETSNAYARGLLAGITDYVRQHAPWSIYLPEQGRGDRPPAWLADWKGDGLIARIENEAIAREVQKLGLPIVDVSAARVLASVPMVETDDRAIAHLVVQHFRERGFRQLAYCGDTRFQWSRWRRDHFVRLAGEANCECAVHEAAGYRGRGAAGHGDHAQLSAWIRSLPKPVGVMACYDIAGQRLLDVCRQLDLAVPEEVAVVGVDNDTLLCELCSPPLSSVEPDAHRTGYLAAELLARMLAGENVSPEARLIPPLQLVTRQSTDVLAIKDKDVAAALRFIREHACAGIRVADILAHARISRRVLEARFRKLLGRSPHEEIVRLKIDRAKQLLRETDLSLAALAERAGFAHVEYLSVAFKRVVGQPPSAYRREFRRP